MNYPNNMMTREFNDTTSNLFKAALSLHSPGILDYIGYERYLAGKESLFDPKTDTYIYSSIQQINTPETSVFTETPNITELFGDKNAKVSTDNIITSYLPFVGNCKSLGNHITFKDMLSSPLCDLVSLNVSLT